MEKRQGNFASAMKGIIKMLELGISKTTGKGSCVSMNGCNLLNITDSDSEDFQLNGGISSVGILPHQEGQGR